MELKQLLCHLLITELEKSKIEIGASKILFHLDYKKWGTFLTYLWVKKLGKFCHERMIHTR